MKIKLTQQILKEKFDYDIETGIFNHKKTKTLRGKIKKQPGTLSNGYIRIQVDGQRIMAHRLAFLYVEGYLPENEVDHIDRNRLNNSWCNLREVSPVCNQRNRTINKDNKSGVTGVHFDTSHNKWRAQVRVLGKCIHLGIYANKIDAVKSRWEGENKYNFPDCNTTSSAYLYLMENQK